MAVYVLKELIPDSYHLGRAADAVVGADGHHAAAGAAFFVKLIEVEFDLFKKLTRRVVSALN